MEPITIATAEEVIKAIKNLAQDTSIPALDALEALRQIRDAAADCVADIHTKRMLDIDEEEEARDEALVFPASEVKVSTADVQVPKPYISNGDDDGDWA